jgi:hypothetical protein
MTRPLVAGAPRGDVVEILKPLWRQNRILRR